MVQDCKEAAESLCNELGWSGPWVMAGLLGALIWARERYKRWQAESDARASMREAAEQKAQASEHKAAAQELRVQVASLSPPPMPPVMPVAPVVIPPLGKPITSDDPPEGEHS